MQGNLFSETETEPSKPGMPKFLNRRVPIWESLGATALAGYVLLGYGFANLTLAGTAIPLGEVMGFTSVLLAVTSNLRRVGAFLQEPAASYWLILLGLSFLHLILDLPKYGVWALRDASFVFEGFFLLLGFLWAARTSNLGPAITALAVLFLLNTAYSLTFPMAAQLADLSPASGIFRRVSLLGDYQVTFLAAGAFYYLLIVRYLRWPRGITLALSLFQICWSLVFQSRAIYLGVLFALLSMGLLGKARQGGRAAVLFAGSSVIFFVFIGLVGIQIPGRLGAVNADFLQRHFESIFLVPDTPAVGSAEWRASLLPEVWARYTASPGRMLFGEGFGEALIDFLIVGDVAVRQPHNTFLTVLLRLGAVGVLVWLLMLWKILVSLVWSVRKLPQNTLAHDLILWFIVLYVLMIDVTTFQPYLEFSQGAVPFYMFMGFALGLARRSRVFVTEGRMEGGHLPASLPFGTGAPRARGMASRPRWRTA